MSDSLLILGRQPALGLTELEALYGAEAVEPVGDHAARLNVSLDEVDFNRLGGSIKLAEIIDTVDTTKWDTLESYLVKKLPSYTSAITTDGKITIGLSNYGLVASPARINATALSIKKATRQLGRSVRIVPNQSTALNSAQIIHNHLVSPNGYEIVLVRSGSSTLVARTMNEQNIASYTIRDRYRPKRDAKVGMLPPKLAQILINLAAGELKATRHETRGTILDPFCGTGVLLQEAMLMGYLVYGTDLESRMVDYSRANLDWLTTQFDIHSSEFVLETGDATSYLWHSPIDFVATETYLGRPFTERPTPRMLAQTVSECNTIIKKFLQNIGQQIAPGTRLALAVPAWNTNSEQISSSTVRDTGRIPQRSVHEAYVSSGAQTSARNVPRKFAHLPLIDQIADLGYNRVSFEHAMNDELLYYREDQFTTRELLVLTRK